MFFCILLVLFFLKKKVSRHRVEIRILQNFILKFQLQRKILEVGKMHLAAFSLVLYKSTIGKEINFRAP